MVLPLEDGVSKQHLSKDTANTPHVDFLVISSPGEHDLGRAVVACRHVAGHLRLLDPSQAEVAYFQIAVLVDEDVAGFQVAVHDAC